MSNLTGITSTSNSCTGTARRDTKKEQTDGKTGQREPLFPNSACDNCV